MRSAPVRSQPSSTRLLQVGVAQVGAPEVRPAQRGAGERGAREVHPPEIQPVEVGAVERPAGEVGAPRTGGILQYGAVAGAVDQTLRERGPAKVGADQHGPLQRRAPRVRLREPRLREDAALAPCPGATPRRGRSA